MCPSIPADAGTCRRFSKATIQPPKSLDDYKVVLYKNQREVGLRKYYGPLLVTRSCPRRKPLSPKLPLYFR